MPTNPSQAGGVKYDTGKPRFDLLPPGPLVDVAKVFTMGSQKYNDRNWELGIQWGRVYGALQRHLQAFWGGETLDPESGLPHLAHAGFGILVLLEFLRTHPELDDRSGEQTGNDVLQKHTQQATQFAVPLQDAQHLHGRDSGCVVLGPQGGLMGGVQVAPPRANASPEALANESIHGRKKCCGDFGL